MIWFMKAWSIIIMLKYADIAKLFIYSVKGNRVSATRVPYERTKYLLNI